MWRGEPMRSVFKWLVSDCPLESLKRYDLNLSNGNSSLWVAPNPALLSRMPDLRLHCMNMAGLLTSLFKQGDFPSPTTGGGLRVRLGNLWVFDGVGGSLTSPIDLILSYRRSRGPGFK
jgi:hypothetical protein